MERKVVIAIGLIVLGIVLAGIVCLAPRGNQSSSISIGVVLPLTGNSAVHGRDILEGINMAYDEFLQSPNSPSLKIRLVVEDNFSTAKGSVTAFEKLAQLYAPPIVIGPVASSDMLSMVPIAEKNRIILFSPAASSPKLSNAGKYIFRMSLLAPDQTKVISDYALRALNTKEAGVLYMNDDTGISYMESFVADFTTSGGHVTFNESFEKTDTDFASHLLRLKTSNVPVAFISGVPKTVGMIMKQAKELNLDVVFLSNYGAEGVDLLNVAKNAANGLVYTSIPVDIEFAAKYHKANQKEPEICVSLGYDAMKIVLALLKDNPNDREALQMAFSHLNFDGVTGNTTILPSGDASKEIVLKTVTNNQFVYLEQIEREITYEH